MLWVVLLIIGAVLLALGYTRRPPSLGLVRAGWGFIIAAAVVLVLALIYVGTPGGVWVVR